MVYTLSQLFTITTENEKAKKDISNLIQQKKEEVSSYNKQMADSLQKGNADDYSRLFAKKTALENEIKGYQDFIDKSGESSIFSQKDIADSWNARVEKYNKELAPKIKKFEETKSELIKYIEDIEKMEDSIKQERLDFIHFSKNDSGFNGYNSITNDTFYQAYYGDKRFLGQDGKFHSCK